MSLKKTSTRAGTVISHTPTVTQHQSRKSWMALAEGRGVAFEVGLCSFDEQSCECVVCQFADLPTFTKTLHKISLNSPSSVLMCSGGKVTQENSRLAFWIQQTFPTLPILFLPRKSFNESEGLAFLRLYALAQDLPALELGLSPKYFCLTAIAAIFHHLLQSSTLSPHTVKFVYQAMEGSLMIDPTTARHLELVTNPIQPKHTLLYVLDHTKTDMGHRLLRMTLLQPSSTLNIIQDRLDAVQAFESEQDLFTIQTALDTLVDLDQTIAFLVRVPSENTIRHSESKINHTLRLKQALLSIQSLAQLLPHTDSLLVNTIQKVLSDPAFGNLPLQECLADPPPPFSLEYLTQAIHQLIQPDAGVNGLLDVARQVYKESTEDIYDLVMGYSETYQLDLKLQFNPSLGFFIQLARNECSLPDLFIHIAQRKKTVQLTTLELLQKNNRVNESLSEVYLMSDKVISDLLQIFRDNINFLYKASEAIALLDMLTSFSSCRLEYQYVRPTFSNTLAIKSGRHPVLDHILSTPLISNDTFMSLSSSFQFITGPNMSGKSTYLKQVALVNIMAHMGSFVPADYGSFRLCDQILSRLTNDSILSDLDTSSFMTEMKEITFLLQQVSHTSLVLIDELGRSTSPQDAMGIAGAVCEALAQSRAFCLFVTHLHPLTRTLVIYPNVVNLQFKVDIQSTDDSCCLQYQYKIVDGACSSTSHYGIQTARLLDLPQELVDAAQEIVKELEKGQNNVYTQDQIKTISKERKLLWFADKFLQLNEASLDNDQLLEQVLALQEDISKEPW